MEPKHQIQILLQFYNVVGQISDHKRELVLNIIATTMGVPVRKFAYIFFSIENMQGKKIYHCNPLSEFFLKNTFSKQVG